MLNNNPFKDWENYREKELRGVRPHLARLGFTLDDRQPHLGGERYLMHSVATVSGRKLILLGVRNSDQRRVVIKVTSDWAGAAELRHERRCRKILRDIKFAHQAFLSPEEILFGKFGSYLIAVQGFIEQEKPYLERPLEEQFRLALTAFKAEAGARATTYHHLRLAKKYFGVVQAEDYLKQFRGFCDRILAVDENNQELRAGLLNANTALEKNKEVIDQYAGFLTHIDFVPHNFRVVNDKIYLLDHSSVRFGNKYESWARFLNFMTLYNPPLLEALERYVRENRTPEESTALHLMRIYRLGEIIFYYTNTLKKSAGDLFKLNKARINFWAAVLSAKLEDRSPTKEIIEEYKKTRDALRSDDERERQIDLH